MKTSKTSKILTSILASLVALSVLTITNPASSVEAKSYLSTQRNGVLKVTVPKQSAGKQMYLVVEKGRQTYSYRLPKSQNISLPFGSGSYHVSVYKGNGRHFEFLEEKSMRTTISSVKQATQQHVLIPGTSEPYVKRILNTQFKGWTKWSADKKVRQVHAYVTKNYRYDYVLEKKVPDWYQPNYSKLSKTKKGICYDFASLNASLLRAMHVPTRLVMGYPSNTTSYHSWNEVYVNKSWKVVDPTFDLGARVKSPYKAVNTYKKVSYRF